MKEPTFEERVKQLDGIIENLEKGSMPLADMIEQYRTGMELSRALRAQLDDARQQLRGIQLEDSEAEAQRAEAEGATANDD